ncbi:hypothetical protein DIPPA_04490 [Diplonema papillatum]|nr:hypothetical protein DIPPA_04490 [Diplonema papillatum]
MDEPSAISGNRRALLVQLMDWLSSDEGDGTAERRKQEKKEKKREKKRKREKREDKKKHHHRRHRTPSPGSPAGRAPAPHHSHAQAQSQLISPAKGGERALPAPAEVATNGAVIEVTESLRALNPIARIGDAAGERSPSQRAAIEALQTLYAVLTSPERDSELRNLAVQRAAGGVEGGVDARRGRVRIQDHGAADRTPPAARPRWQPGAHPAAKPRGAAAPMSGGATPPQGRMGRNRPAAHMPARQPPPASGSSTSRVLEYSPMVSYADPPLGLASRSPSPLAGLARAASTRSGTPQTPARGRYLKKYVESAPSPVWNRLYSHGVETLAEKDLIAREHEAMRERERMYDTECTFRPSTTMRHEAEDDLRERPERVFRALHADSVSRMRRLERKREVTEWREAQEVCTFMPSVNEPKDSVTNPPNSPWEVNYYEKLFHEAQARRDKLEQKQRAARPQVRVIRSTPKSQEEFFKRSERLIQQGTVEIGWLRRLYKVAERSSLSHLSAAEAAQVKIALETDLKVKRILDLDDSVLSKMVPRTDFASILDALDNLSIDSSDSAAVVSWEGLCDLYHKYTVEANPDPNCTHRPDTMHIHHPRAKAAAKPLSKAEVDGAFARLSKVKRRPVSPGSAESPAATPQRSRPRQRTKSPAARRQSPSAAPRNASPSAPAASATRKRSTSNLSGKGGPPATPAASKPAQLPPKTPVDPPARPRPDESPPPKPREAAPVPSVGGGAKEFKLELGSRSDSDDDFHDADDEPETPKPAKAQKKVSISVRQDSASSEPSAHRPPPYLVPRGAVTDGKTAKALEALKLKLSQTPRSPTPPPPAAAQPPPSRAASPTPSDIAAAVAVRAAGGGKGGVVGSGVLARIAAGVAAVGGRGSGGLSPRPGGTGTPRGGTITPRGGTGTPRGTGRGLPLSQQVLAGSVSTRGSSPPPLQQPASPAVSAKGVKHPPNSPLRPFVAPPSQAPTPPPGMNVVKGGGGPPVKTPAQEPRMHSPSVKTPVIRPDASFRSATSTSSALRGSVKRPPPSPGALSDGSAPPPAVPPIKSHGQPPSSKGHGEAPPTVGVKQRPPPPLKQPPPAPGKVTAASPFRKKPEPMSERGSDVHSQAASPVSHSPSQYPSDPGEMSGSMRPPSVRTRKKIVLCRHCEKDKSTVKTCPVTGKEHKAPAEARSSICGSCSNDIRTLSVCPVTQQPHLQPAYGY